MRKYLLKRVFYMALTLFLVATITFFFNEVDAWNTVFKPAENDPTANSNYEPTIWT